MELRKTNRRSCVLDAFSYAIGVEPQVLIDIIGHDGSEGVPTQQAISALLTLGYAVTTIERRPSVQDPCTGIVRRVEFSPSQRGYGRWGWELSRGNGVLIGRGNNNLPHAVPWMAGKQVGPIEVSDPHVFFRVDKIECL